MVFTEERSHDQAVRRAGGLRTDWQSRWRCQGGEVQARKATDSWRTTEKGRDGLHEEHGLAFLAQMARFRRLRGG